jgi:hypothetical protein
MWKASSAAICGPSFGEAANETAAVIDIVPWVDSSACNVQGTKFALPATCCTAR